MMNRMASHFPRLILASASPRRREILAAAGILFEAHPSSVREETRDGETPEQLVRRLAMQKAAEVALRFPLDIVLGCDTEVVIDGRTLGKPRDDRHAAEMLRLLSGRSHIVLSGLCLIAGEKISVETAATTVWISPMSESEIAAYVASGEPRDKAGAYAIQGLAARFVERIEGCYFNVVGLPVATLYRMLRELDA
jgi:septum formation protein